MNKNILKYWKRKINILHWKKKPKSILKIKKNNFFEWYKDGKINLTYNCIENNLRRGFGEKKSIIFFDRNFVRKEYSYNELSNLVNSFANILEKKLKDKINPTVLIHGSASIETSVSMLACSKLGFHFSVLFEDLPNKAIKLREKILKPELIISRKNNEKNFSNKNQIIFSKKKSFKKSILNIDIEKLKKNSRKNTYKYFQSNRTLFTLFTSGSTGEPKGIQHSTGGYLLYAKLTCKKQFGINKNSIVLTASDAGWINGHTYSLFGPLSLGSTTILLEKPIMLLKNNFLQQVIKNEKVSVLYLPVTLAKLIKSLNIKRLKSRYIKSVGSMGEPLSPSLNKWLSKKFTFKKIPVVNTYFQTETGGIIYSPKYNQKYKNVVLGSVGKSISKEIKLYNSHKTKKFEIIIDNLWPGCMKNVINGLKIWKTYWIDGKFKMFDIGSFRKKDLIIHGRNDDVINIRGHRLGSEEVESVLMENKDIIESSAVSVNDKIEGSRMIIFVGIKKGVNKIILEKQIIKIVTNHFGSFSKPKKIFFLSSLPKTRSGKILRRLLRDIFQKPNKKNLGDLSTMQNFDKINLLKSEINEQR